MKSFMSELKKSFHDRTSLVCFIIRDYDLVIYVSTLAHIVI